MIHRNGLFTIRSAYDAVTKSPAARDPIWQHNLENEHYAESMDLEAEDTKSQVENTEHPLGLEPLTKKAKKKECPQVQAKVQVLNDHPEKIPPIVGYFPSGFDPQKNLNNDSESMNFKVYRNKKNPKRLQLVVSPNGSPVDFVSTSYSGEAKADL
ncbi:hypothetical protein K1719_022661 [Acacia pycnantha]|nr:hypothetical protein K1719_022661 [Acacia pycnantha]